MKNNSDIDDGSSFVCVHNNNNNKKNQTHDENLSCTSLRFPFSLLAGYKYGVIHLQLLQFCFHYNKNTVRTMTLYKLPAT